MWNAYDIERERDPFGDTRREEAAHQTTKAKLGAAQAELVRLREGIEGLIEDCEGGARLNSRPDSDELSGGMAAAYREDAAALRALLDGEGQG